VFPVFGCVVGLAFADAWTVAAAAAALFVTRMPGGAVGSPLCFTSKVAPKAAAAFFWNCPSWMLEQRPCSEDDYWTHFDFKPPSPI